MRSCLAVWRGANWEVLPLLALADTVCFELPLIRTPLVRVPLECEACTFTWTGGDFIGVERRSALGALAALLTAAAGRILASFCAARTSALTNSSVRMECQPDRPLLLAMSARSFQV